MRLDDAADARSRRQRRKIPASTGTETSRRLTSIAYFSCYVDRDRTRAPLGRRSSARCRRTAADRDTPRPSPSLADVSIAALRSDRFIADGGALHLRHRAERQRFRLRPSVFPAAPSVRAAVSVAGLRCSPRHPACAAAVSAARLRRAPRHPACAAAGSERREVFAITG